MWWGGRQIDIELEMQDEIPSISDVSPIPDGIINRWIRQNQPRVAVKDSEHKTVTDMLSDAELDLLEKAYNPKPKKKGEEEKEKEKGYPHGYPEGSTVQISDHRGATRSLGINEATKLALEAQTLLLLRLCSAGGDKKAVAQCLIVLPVLMDVVAKTPVVAWHDLQPVREPKNAKSPLGRILVGLKYEVELPASQPASIDASSEDQRLGLIHETVFHKYDSNNDGYLNHDEFMRFCTDLDHAGGRIRGLAPEHNNCSKTIFGWLLGLSMGFFGPLPTPDSGLIEYVEHNHSLLIVWFLSVRLLPLPS